MHGRALIFIAAVAGLTACESSTDAKVTYSAQMTAAKEVPAVTVPAPNATGTFTATLEGNVLTYSFTFTGLTSNTNNAHIHGPASATVAANPLVDFNSPTNNRTFTLGATAGVGNGTVNIAPTAVITVTVSGDSLRKLLDSGNTYINVHTVNNPGGEIRGQITRQ